MKSSRFAAFLFSAVFLLIGLASAAEPGVEQRLADLEAYVRNTAPTGPLQGQPGPGWGDGQNAADAKLQVGVRQALRSWETRGSRTA